MNDGGRQSRLDFLDVARGGAAVVVMAEHALHLGFPQYHAFSASHIVAGQAAILVFFMISGFVVPMSLENGGSVGKFWIRRCFRLFPVYWLSILLAYAHVRAGGSHLTHVGPSDASTWLTNVFLVQGLAHRPNVLGVYWSLHFELGLYVVFSILFVCGLAVRLGPGRFALAVVAIASVAAALPWMTGRPASNYERKMVATAAAFGFMAYCHLSGKWSRGTFYALAALLCVAQIGGWLSNWAAFPTAEIAGHFVRCTILLGMAYGAFLFLLERRNLPMPKTALWLGRRSYPIYLLHPFVLAWSMPLVGTWWLFLPCVATASVLLAEMAHRLVEAPGIALGRRIDRWGRPSAPPAESVPMRKAA